MVSFVFILSSDFNFFKTTRLSQFIISLSSNHSSLLFLLLLPSPANNKKDPHKPNQDNYSITRKKSTSPATHNEEDAFLAVYDGHGPVGEHFSTYAQQTLPRLLEKYAKQVQVRHLKEYNASLAKDEKKTPFNPKLFPKLDAEDYMQASIQAHVECNRKMIDTQPLVNLSGSTAISAAFHNGYLIISNVGDSRAILGTRATENNDNGSSNKVIAKPLSQDQTPWRKDERLRIRKEGGRVMTIDEMEGKVPLREDDDYGDWNLGEMGDIDVEGDPPRVCKCHVVVACGCVYVYDVM